MKRKKFINNIIIPFFLLLTQLIKAQEADSIRIRIELDEVEVTGRRTPSVYNKVARSISVISSSEISSSPYSTVQDILEHVPFADIRQRNVHGVQADISLRGGTFDQVMVLLNGINITDPQTGHFNLDLPVELGSIERIEVLHGSGSRLYGANAYKGVVNIITRKKDNTIRAGADYGQHRLFHPFASAGWSKDKFYGNFGLSGNYSKGFTENTDYRLNHMFYRGGYENEKVSVDLQAGAGTKKFGANDFYSPSFPDQYEETSSKFGSLAFGSKGKIRLAASGYWRRHYDHFLLRRYEPSFYENYHRTDVYGIRTNTSFSSPAGKTFAGIELRHEGILSTSLGKELQVPVRVGEAVTAMYTKSYARNTTAFFLEHSFNMKDFSFTGGFLLDINKVTSRPGFYPGIDAGWHFPRRNGRLFASVNRSMRLPTFTDLFYRDPANAGNTSLIAEKMFALEGGVEFESDPITTRLTLFRDDGRDVIDWIWDEGVKKYNAMNISRIMTKGFEIKTEYSNPGTSSSFIRKAGISWSYIDPEKNTGNLESKYSLDNLKHKLQLSFTGRISKRISTGWRTAYYSRNGSFLEYNDKEKTTFSSPFKPYWLVDSGLSWHSQAVSVNANVSNLLNTRYTDTGSLFQPGRWITVGVRLNLDFSGE